MGRYEFLVTVRPLYRAHLGPCDATISYHIISFIILYVEEGVWVNRVRRRVSYWCEHPSPVNSTPNGVDGFYDLMLHEKVGDYKWVIKRVY